MKAQGYQTVTRSRAGKDGVSAFKSVVFKRSNEDIDAPVGGAYDSPVPSGWSDGVPGGEEKLWMSTRIFTNTGGAPQQAAWTTPSVVTDTADIDFEFSAAASNPGNPTSSPKLWHNTATSDDVWMAVRKKSNGVWGAWEVSKTKGEDGKGIVSQVDYYAVSASKTEVPTNWTPNTPPSMTATLRYLWKYTLTTFTDGSTEQTAPCVVGVFGVDGLSYRYSKWVAGVEYRNDNNPYYRDSNGQGIIDVVYVNGITMYDPNSNTPPPAGYICRKTHRSNGTIEFASVGDWAQSGNTFTSNKIKASTSTWAKIIFKTYVANTVITVKITASSEARYDWGYVCGLDKAYSTSDYLARVSGTDSQTVEITVPTMGEHYFYVGYTKDRSGDNNNDNTVVEIISVSPSSSPIPLVVGEYWTQMNSMAPILSALVIADRIKANHIDVDSLAADTAFIDSLIVNKLVAGKQNGQRVEVMPDSKSVNIYDANGTLASTFEGNNYTDILSLFGSQASGTITVTEESGTKQINANGISYTPISSPTHLLTSSKITVGGGTLSIQPIITSSGGATYITWMHLYLCTYSEASCTNKIQTSRVYTIGANSKYSQNTQTGSFTKKETVVPEGWTRLEICVESSLTGTPMLICSWADIKDVTYTSDFYISRYFANGLCLGRNQNNYIAIYNDGLLTGMNCSMVNGDYGFDFRADGIFFKRSATEERKRLTPPRGLPFAALAVGTMLLNSKSPSMGSYITIDGSNTGMSVSYQSDGTFKVRIPSSWGNTYIVQLTTLGRTDNNNPIGASVSSISTGSFIVDTMSLKGTWVNEAKVMFIITDIMDFNG